MKVDTLEVTSPGESSPDQAGSLRFVARQPILDRRGRLHAYELLFRSGPEAQFRGDGELATRTMIDNTVFFGLNSLTGGHPAFVNCTAETLKTKDLGILSPETTVIEVLEDVQPDADVIAACKDLQAQGYRIALDDFVWSADLVPLIRLADYIKVDYMKSNRAERREILLRIKEHFRGDLLAEKVETRADFEQAVLDGFTYFQGYYFCKPVLMSKRKVPANQLVHVRMLQLASEQPLDLKKISELVSQDPALTYRVLRMVNSAATGLKQEIHSIENALLALGDNLFRRTMMVAIATDLSSGKSKELLRMAFVRARFCELAAGPCGFDAAGQYLLGMLSLLPAMLDTPMEEVLHALPLRDDLQDALLGHPIALRSPLLWLEAYERGDWDQCDAMARACAQYPDDLMARFAQAVQWAAEVLPAD